MRILVVVLLGLMAAGCATVTRGTTEMMQFDSSPSGAEVRTAITSNCTGPCPLPDPNAPPPVVYRGPPEPGGGQFDDHSRRNAASGPEVAVPGPACVTPCQVEIKRNDSLVATFSKPGFKPVTVPIEKRLAGAGAAGFAGNVIIGGGIGMFVDAASGATLEHHPNPLRVTLEPETAATPPRQPRPKKPKPTS
jgi:hypothetical protein